MQHLRMQCLNIYKNGVATGITAVTNSSGIAYFKRISVETDAADTRYEVIEKTAPAGYRAPTAVDRILFASNKSELNIYADADTNAKNGDRNCLGMEIIN